MKKFIALFRARNKEFYRDHGTLIWTFVFPFIVIFGFAYGYSGRSQALYKVGVFYKGSSPTSTKFLKMDHISFLEMSDVASGIAKVKRHQIDLLLSSGKENRYWINSSSPQGYIVEKLLLGSAHGSGHFEKQVVEGKEPRYVDWLIPGILAMNMMFSSLFGVGYTIVRYRKNGVLKRLKATPVTAINFLSAQVLSRLILIQMSSIIVFFGSFWLVHFEMNGSYLELFLYMSLGAFCMIALGLIVAARISSEELAEGILNIATWPMMFLSGIWFSLEGASPFVRSFARIFPLTHIVDGMRAIMIDGAHLTQLLPQVSTLAIMSVCFLLIGSAIFKWN